MALDLGVFLQAATSSYTVKVSENDQQSDYLLNKLFSSDGSVVITETSNGGIEQIDLTITASGGGNFADTDLTFDANRNHDLAAFDLNFNNAGKVAINTTTDGLLIPRLTTAQMNAILTPDTNLLIFNTDAEGLYRYDGAAWVALTVGYGIVSVITDADAGIPTFYADVQTALDACKTSGSHNVVTLYSNFTISSQLEITNTAGFLFEGLLIDLNGFKILNDAADADDTLYIDLGSSAVNRKISIINGYLTRDNQTGTSGGVLYVAFNSEGGLSMSNVVCYNSASGRGAYFQLAEDSENQADPIVNLGGSVFISSNGTGVKFQGGKFKSFAGIALGSGDGVNTECYLTQNFYAESSTGNGLRTASGCEIVSHFSARSGSGFGYYNQNFTNHQVSNFTARSETSWGIYSINSGGKFSNFESYSNTNYAMYVSNDQWISNGLLVTNSGSAAGLIDKGSIINGVTFINNTGAYGAIFDNAGAHVTNCVFYAKAGIGARVTDGHTISNTLFKSDLNTSSGHACEFTGIATTIYVSLCKFEVTNSGANCIYAASAQTVNMANNVYGNVATTPVNANVTITATGTPDTYGNIQE